jgi:hypothetical protein
MKTVLWTSFSMVLVLLAAFSGTGCQKERDRAQAAESEKLPADLIADAAPAGAIDVVKTKELAKDGERIVVKGRVGGQKAPLAPNRAIATLADISLPTCDKSPMDKCETPWDSCCEPSEKITANTLTVQVVAADGKPIKAGLSGVGGITQMKELVVSGIAKRASGSDSLIVQATRIYVVP